MSELLNQEEFLQLVASQFSLPIPIGSENSLQPLGFDSLMRCEIVVFIEELVSQGDGKLIIDFPIVNTMADAFALYEQMMEWRE